MADVAFNQVPKEVPQVQTKFRRIVTKLPVPESLPTLERLRRCEPRSMGGQPPIVWHHAEGFQVYDAWGNMWLDMSSGVLVTNCGHGHPKVRAAVEKMAEQGLLTTYCFPNEPRALLAEKLCQITPEGLDKVFLLTTGSEASENAIKLARTYGMKVGGPEKSVLVTFENAFHGRTLGSQLAGGSLALKSWIGELDQRFVQVPFPDGFYGEDTSFEGFLKALDQKGVEYDKVCGVMSETYQGATAAFAPPTFMQQLKKWCAEHDALLILDEVQAGFGRTGTLFGFEHYGIVPDIIFCGKGVSSSLPLSAVLGRKDVMDLYGPGAMTSTHSGNAVCAAAALANIEVILEENLVRNAAELGKVLKAELAKFESDYDCIGKHFSTGLVGALLFVKRGTKEPDKPLAWKVVERCVQKGLLFFAPVGKGGGCIKVCPPLCVTEEALLDALKTLRETIDEVA